ncbi:MAG: hypothetical protein ONB27_13350 [candidate division KSB1 bacterium]|nr:hypothetical protein [candidate division KSB1 bacterium]
MKIYSRTGYLIIMDPAYLKVADATEIQRIDFVSQPLEAAQKLERSLFPDAYGGLIGLAKLKEGPGMYEVDLQQVAFWDVETKGNKVIFGVDLGSFIMFDVQWIKLLIQQFDPLLYDHEDEEIYFQSLQQKMGDRQPTIIWSRSPLPFAEGWHELPLSAFKKIN